MARGLVRMRFYLASFCQGYTLPTEELDLQYSLLAGCSQLMLDPTFNLKFYYQFARCTKVELIFRG